MKKTFALNTNVEVQTLREDAEVSKAADIVRQLAQRELQHRIELIEKDRTSRFFTNQMHNESTNINNLVASVRSRQEANGETPTFALEVGPPQATGGVSRADYESAGYVGMYRTRECVQAEAEAKAQKSFERLMKLFSEDEGDGIFSLLGLR
jgi:hypothetical protein